MGNLYLIILFIIIVLLLLSKIKILINFNNGENTIYVKYLLFKFLIFRSNDKNLSSVKLKKKTKKSNRKNGRLTDKKDNLNYAKKSKYSQLNKVNIILDIIKTLNKLFSRFKRHVYISNFALDVKVSTDDAAETAIQYGKICAAVYSLTSILHNIVEFTIDYINIWLDFTSVKTSYFLNCKIHFRIVTMLYILLRMIFDFLINVYIRLIKNKKGGSRDEQ